VASKTPRKWPPRVSLQRLAGVATLAQNAVMRLSTVPNNKSMHMNRVTLVLACLFATFFSVVPILAEEGPATTNAAEAGPDFAVQGEYLGTLKIDGADIPHGAQVIALGEGKFHAIVFPGGLPGDGWEGRFVLDNQQGIYPGYGAAPADWARGPMVHQAAGETKDGITTFENAEGKAVIADGVMTISHKDGQELGQLRHVLRESPTLGAKPPEGATVLFDGSTADHFEGGRLTEDGLLIAGCLGKDPFKDFTLHLEFRTPFMPQAREQGRGNSGMYLQNRYEVQVLDSFGLEGRNNECSGLYSLQAPRLNMCYPPLSWQTYDADFQAARFGADGSKTANAVLTLRFNGVVVYDAIELTDKTPGGADTEYPGEGPLQLQDHGNPVHYRNIWVLEKK
jgi:hypothetical protein